MRFTEIRDWHALEPAVLEEALETGARGLTEEQARARLEEFGPNRLEDAAPPSVIRTALNQFRSPLISILLVAAVVTTALGEYIDSAVIGAAVLLNAVIGFTQEWRAEGAVRALMGMVAPKAHVIRDGRDREIESADLVPGDLLLLETGSIVSADARLVQVTALAIDESLLTGESAPAKKRPAPLDAHVVIADRANMAFSGTTVTAGRARGYVVATGATTALGGIAEQMRETAEPVTPLQRRMASFARIIGLAIAAGSAIAFVIGVAMQRSVTEMFMVAVALAVAAIPEGLPVVFTITLAIGVRRMARRNAIIRRLPAVETLGSTTTIGSDKTGTLTESRMTVQEIWAGGGTISLKRDDGGPGTLDDSHPAALALLAGVLTNEAHVHEGEDGLEITGDPTEAALLVSARALGIDPAEAREGCEVLEEIPFESERRYSASRRRMPDGDTLLVVKGAPERVLGMCERIATTSGDQPLDPDRVHAAAREMAKKGLRVLAMAGRRDDGAPLEDADPDGLTFYGLQGMLDPPREGVRESIAGCHDAGIRVVMITGDHAITAKAVAEDLGIQRHDGAVLTGSELEHMDEDHLAKQTGEVAVYARVAPEHKLRIVQALRARGEVVAVTGDGVNDAPALKAADIGVAMGRGGTDVAREASDMVLADDNFVSITAAVEQGRITFDNLRKVTFFLISTGAAMIVAILTALALDWPLIMLPAQILWLNLVTNGLQDIALAFEPGERDILQRPPRPRDEGVISRLLWERAAFAGLIMATGTLIMFRWELDASGDLARAQTVALTTMVLFQMFQAGNARSEHRSVFRMSPVSNPFLFIAVAAALAIHVAAVYTPAGQFVLRVEPLDAATWIRMLAVAGSIVVGMELHKLVRSRRRPTP